MDVLKENHFQKDSTNFQQGLVTLKIQVLQPLVADMKKRIECIFNQYSKLYFILNAQSEVQDLN